jgi:glycosyltransferase involved in cell wall biosynthesis
VRTAHGPDLMLANSTFVKARIQRIYGREARVVFPPVALNELSHSAEKDDYYITASFLAPYKRTDLVIEAFNEMPSRRLIVVGDGQQSARLRALAKSNIEFAGFLPRQDYVAAVSKARALVFAGCEDFGIALAEAQACGTPLIAFGRGGATDIVRPLGRAERPTGILFREQTIAAVKAALNDFEAHCDLLRPEACRDNGSRFGAQRFRREIADAFQATLKLHGDQAQFAAA